MTCSRAPKSSQRDEISSKTSGKVRGLYQNGCKGRMHGMLMHTWHWEGPGKLLPNERIVAGIAWSLAEGIQEAQQVTTVHDLLGHKVPQPSQSHPRTFRIVNARESEPRRDSPSVSLAPIFAPNAFYSVQRDPLSEHQWGYR